MLSVADILLYPENQHIRKRNLSIDSYFSLKNADKKRCNFKGLAAGALPALTL